MSKILYLGMCFLFCFYCTPVFAQTTPTDKELLRVAAMLSGDFDSGQQSKKDTNYYHISLHMRTIWPQLQDGKTVWLYIEQAMAAKQEKPYRQRIYKLERVGPDKFVSAIYILPDETKWIGKWASVADFDAISPAQLTLKPGCEVYLTRKGRKLYEGGTAATGCESMLRGAKYATSKVTLTPKMLLSWDQGFDDTGDQVWGAEKGGYKFMRL